MYMYIYRRKKRLLASLLALKQRSKSDILQKIRLYVQTKLRNFFLKIIILKQQQKSTGKKQAEKIRCVF